MVAKYKMKILLLTLSASASLATLVCRESEFSCDGSRCIPRKWLCDGDPDCTDGTDELTTNCPAKASDGGRTCRASEFQCGNGNCIPQTWKCDGQDDCRDNTDEESCEKTCRDTQFQCVSDKQCITKKWRCDNQKDCQDGSDEENCEEEVATVPPHMFRCASGITIPTRWLCDGEEDCTEGSDEKNCPGGEANKPQEKSDPCRDNEFQCGAYCVMATWVCDGGVDCPNGEDEANCDKECPESHFTCNNKQCILGHLRCNGEKECADGSDESDCPKVPAVTDAPKVECNLTSHFLCSLNKCIHRRNLCNGRNDCGDWQDESEEECGVNECERNNGGCTHLCVDSRESYHCECRTGYRLVGKYTCEDIDECLEVPGTCSQQCTNTNGGYHCSCLPGYERDPGNYTRCKASTGEPYLLFSHRYDIRSLRLRDNDMTSVVSDAREATALDYLFTGHQIIWSDNKENQIIRANITTPEEREVLVTGEQVSADGLAVDWIHNHIYYTDTGNFKIRLVSWDAKWSKTIVQEELGQPRAIVVSPLDGYVFWTDWGMSPKIERAGLDGEGRTAIVTAPHVYWPNGITIDLPNNDLYWCDGKLNTISKARLDGTQIEVVLFSPSVLRLPYSITVFEDRLYWTDWSQLALYSANKFNGEDIHNVSAGHLLESPKVVHVFHEYRQPSGENVCDGHTCSHLCIRSPMGMAKCMCPDGLLLSTRDSISCLEGELPDIMEPSSEPVNPMIPVLPSDFDYSNEEIIPLETNKYEKIQTLEGSNFSVIFAVGVGSAVVLAIVVMVLVGLWRKRVAAEVPHMRFPNPVYRKTTDEEMDGGGYIIGHDDLLFKPQAVQYSEGPDIPEGDSDDTPLAPKK